MLFLKISHFGNAASVIGDQGFKEFIAEQKEELRLKREIDSILSQRPSVKAIILAVAKVYDVEVRDIKLKKMGRQTSNVPRKMAIYICQQYGDLSLKSIAHEFGLNHQGSVSPAIRDIKSGINERGLQQQLNKILSDLSIIK